jgi:hypothetical protein
VTLLRVHPAAELFPLMADTDPAALKELAEDIKAHGLRAPIVGWKQEYLGGQFLLDGRNRLDALALLGLLYETADHHVGLKKWIGIISGGTRPGGRLEFGQNFCGGDPFAIALSLNVHRRHLTNEQKRERIANVLKAAPEKSNRQIAEQVKDDHKKVGDVRAKLEATGEIPQLKKTTGKDGKARKKPAKAKKKSVSITAPIEVETDGPTASAELRKRQYATDEQEVTLPSATNDAPSAVNAIAMAKAEPLAANDGALLNFTALLLELLRLTAEQKAERFANTAVKVDDLAQLGQFLDDLVAHLIIDGDRR